MFLIRDFETKNFILTEKTPSLWIRYEVDNSIINLNLSESVLGKTITEQIKIYKNKPSFVCYWQLYPEPHKDQQAMIFSNPNNILYKFFEANYGDKIYEAVDLDISDNFKNLKENG